MSQVMEHPRGLQAGLRAGAGERARGPVLAVGWAWGCRIERELRTEVWLSVQDNGSAAGELPVGPAKSEGAVENPGAQLMYRVEA